ncbi:MAG: NAD-binding protein [Desulfobacterales bacterium]|nr:NAD-binding protein [Desulfobacterales bacterium]MDD3082838.1 NAD-binding protein [Desulfobacterales bacterium]MDD3951988.1 NAD-binding protein [Desulfobacterales bacterium]MDD4464773.1 NAD-binding protein [Desulfobacterales bacterium]
MKEFWILGAGRFGKKAVRDLTGRYPGCRILVVDQDRASLEGLKDHSIQVAEADAVSWLADNLRPDRPDWIVPMVPVHVAYEWLKIKVLKSHELIPVAVPSNVFQKVPHPMPSGDDCLFMSHADFICPDNCPEPRNHCTVTGKPRTALFDLLQALAPGNNYQCIVLRSRQLAPGVGGFRPVSLLNVMKKAVSANGPILLSTVCRCHGVMHAFSLRKRLGKS